jgi:peroxiredoxin
MMSKKILGVLAASGVALCAVSFTAVAEPPKDQPAGEKHADKKADKKDEKSAPKLAVGQKAPEFSLTDTDGKTVKLADFKDKIVVLEWYNPGCPFIVKHHKDAPTFNNLHKDFSDKGVVFLAINSSAKGKEGHGLDYNKTKKEEFKLPFPVLIDEDGTVGRLYGARTTPHCFIIGKDGSLAYNGAIDNNKTGADNKNYVRVALEQMLRGETVTEATTKPYGCSVKYAAK